MKKVVDAETAAVDSILAKGEKLYKIEASIKIKPTSLDMHQIAKFKVVINDGSFCITTNLFNTCIRVPVGLPPYYHGLYSYLQCYQIIQLQVEKKHKLTQHSATTTNQLQHSH